MSGPRLSVVVPYYRNPVMLDRQFWLWSNETPTGILDAVEFVVVDDASPESAWAVAQSTTYASQLPHFQLLRVKVDTPWHQHGARNLGAHVATGKWLLMTDIDHVIPPETLAALLAADDGDEDCAFFFDRVDAPAGERWNPEDWPMMAPTLNREGKPKPHVNSFAITRDLYWKIGGYDEDYCGVYGTDSLFRKRMAAQSRRVQLPLPLIRVAREVIQDASTTTLPRKEGRPRGVKAAIAHAKAKRGEADVVKVLQFEWERVL